MEETVAMEAVNSALIKNGNEKVEFTKNPNLTSDEDVETKATNDTEEHNVSNFHIVLNIENASL